MYCILKQCRNSTALVYLLILGFLLTLELVVHPVNFFGKRVDDASPKNGAKVELPVVQFAVSNAQLNPSIGRGLFDASGVERKMRIRWLGWRRL